MTTPAERKLAVALVVMGPSGTGKTTTAQLLSARLGWLFAEGDQFHPQANIEKMSEGIPLTDADRAPWLAGIRDWISRRAGEDKDVVVTCSALRRIYRDTLRDARADVRFLELRADQNVVAARMGARSGHFMPASLLASQFSILEPLAPDEPGVRVAADAPPDIVVTQALAALDLPNP